MSLIFVITGIVVRLTQRVPLDEQELLTLSQHPPGAPESNPGFQWCSFYPIFSLMCMFCRSLFVLLCCRSLL